MVASGLNQCRHLSEPAGIPSVLSLPCELKEEGAWCQKTGHLWAEWCWTKVSSLVSGVYMVSPMGSASSLVAQMVKNLPATQETWVQSLGWEDFPGVGNGPPFQYSCLESFMDRGAWRVIVHGVVKSQIQLSTHRAKGDLEQVILTELVILTPHASESILN